MTTPGPLEQIAAELIGRTIIDKLRSMPVAERAFIVGITGDLRDATEETGND